MTSRLHYLVIFSDVSSPGGEAHAFIFDLDAGLWELGNRMQELDEWVGLPQDESRNPVQEIYMAPVTMSAPDRFELNVLGADHVYHMLKTLTGVCGPVINITDPDFKFGDHIWHLTPPE